MGERRRAGRVLASALLLLAACYERGGGDKAEAKKKQPAVNPTPVAAAIDAGASVAPASNAVLHLRLAAEPAHLNPFLAGEATVNRVCLGDVYEGLLCARGLDQPPRPCLAASVSVSADGKTWTFRMRPGVEWHDGKPFSVADAAFTFGLLKNPKVVTWLRGDFGDLSRVRSHDDQLVLQFSSFRPGRRAAFARLPILPKHVFAGSVAALASSPANRHPIGTGPLRFVSWTAGQKLRLSRFADYWGAKPRLAGVSYTIVSSRQRAVAALAAGTLDVVTELPIDEALAAKRQHSALRLFSYPRHAYLAAVDNLRKPVLADVHVRRALTHSLDRAAIVEKIFHGYADVITGPFPKHSAAYASDVKPLAFGAKLVAAELAKRTLKKLPVIHLLVPTESRTMRRIADIWVEDAKPYLRLQVELAPFAKVLARARAGRFDVALLAFTTSPELDVYTRLHSSQAGRENYGAVRDAKLDALIEKARTTPDAATRAKLSRAIHRRIHELQPYTFIASDRRLGLARPDVSGIRAGEYGLVARALWRAK